MSSKFLVTTSWDDGHPLDIKIAEMLTRFGIAGTFYVPLQSEFGVMDRNQIRELSRRFEIGAHTLNHVYLDSVSRDIAQRQIVESKAALEDICASECRLFCFPGGRFAPEHLEIVKQAGYSAVRTVEMMSLQPPALRSGLAVIPTTLQVFQHSRLSYIKNVAKRWGLKNIIPLSLSLRNSELLTTVHLLLDRAAQTGGVFHLWGHSWEIETHGLWPNLESVLSLISSYRPRAKFVANGALSSYAH